MNHRGEGWKKANEITKLGETRSMILEVMRLKRINSPYEAIPTIKVTYFANELRFARGFRKSNEHSTGGRISELRGLKLIEVIPGEIEEYDYQEKRMRTKPAALYYLSEAGKACPLDPDWNPQSKSDTMTELVNLIGGFFKQ